MAHFAEIDDNNIVLQVVVTNNAYPQEGYEWLIATFGGTWVKTSYNGNIRKNFAAIGHTYDAVRDAFIPPTPFASWVLNEETCHWEAPVAYPAEGSHTWDEDTISWKEVE